MSEKLTGADLTKALKDRGLPDEGTADEKRAAVAAYDAANPDPTPDTATPPATANDTADPTAPTPETTRLNSDITKPSTTAPGDGPADTTDPRETAHTVTPRPGPEALKAGTVNAVLPGEPVPTGAVVAKADQRVEQYPATRPDGTQVTVTHNIDTGETSVS